MKKVELLSRIVALEAEVAMLKAKQGVPLTGPGVIGPGLWPPMPQPEYPSTNPAPYQPWPFTTTCNAQ